jgi:hypothetical protein
MILQELGNPFTGRNACSQGVEVNGSASCQRFVSSFSGEVGVD